MRLANVFFTLAMATTAAMAAPMENPGPLQKGAVFLPPKSHVLSRLEGEGTNFAGWSDWAKSTLETKYHRNMGELQKKLRRLYGDLDAVPAEVKLKEEQSLWQQFKDNLKNLKADADWKSAVIDRKLARIAPEYNEEFQVRAEAAAQAKARARASMSIPQLRKALERTRETLEHSERWRLRNRRGEGKGHEDLQAELRREIAELEEALKQAEQKGSKAAPKEAPREETGDEGGAGATGADNFSTSGGFSRKSAQLGQLPRPSELVVDGGLWNLLKGGAAGATYGGYEVLRRIPGIGSFGLSDKVLSF